MCDPVSLGTIALTAGGGLISGISQQNQVNRQNAENLRAYRASRDARMRELARQDAFEKEAVAAWDKSMEGLTPDKQASVQEDAQRTFMEEFDGGRSDDVSGQFLSGQQYAGDEVRADIARRTNEATAEARRRAEALAKLSSYGAAETANRATLSDTSNWLQTLNGLRRGSLGVSQQEQSIPAAQIPAGSGQALGAAVSGLGTLFSGMNWNPGAGMAPSAAPFRMGFASPEQRR